MKSKEKPVKIVWLSLLALLMLGLGSCAPSIAGDSRGIIGRSKDVELDSSPVVAQQPDSPSKAATARNDMLLSSKSGNAGTGGVLSGGIWAPQLNDFPIFFNKKQEVIAIYPLADGVEGPDSRGVITLHRDGKVLGWDLQSSRAHLLLDVGYRLKAAALSPSQHLVITSPEAGQGVGTVQLWNLKERQIASELRRLKVRAIAFSFDPDSAAVAIAGSDGRVYRWRFDELLSSRVQNESSRDFERHVGHATVVNAVAYHPSGRVFFSGDWHGGLNAWLSYDTDSHGGEYDRNIFGGQFFTDVETRRNARKKAGVGIEQIVPTVEGRYLYISLSDGGVELWKVRGLKLLLSAKAHKGLVIRMAVAPAGDRLATYGRDGLLSIWQLVSKTVGVELDLTFELEKAAQLELPDLTGLTFVDNDLLVAGSKRGDLIEVDIPVVIKEHSSGDG